MIRYLAFFGISLGLVACETTTTTATVEPATQRVIEESRFTELAVGRPLYTGSNYLMLQPSGQLGGEFGGSPLVGTWEWRDGAFCRTLTSAQGPLEDCQTVEIVDQGLQFTRDRGAGISFIYTMEPTANPL